MNTLYNYNEKFLYLFIHKQEYYIEKQKIIDSILKII